MINEKEAPELEFPWNTKSVARITISFPSPMQPEKPKDRTGYVQINREGIITGWKFTN